MNAATSGLRILIRIAFLVELALGLLFWSGNLVALVPLHQLLGLLLVRGLWGLVVIAAIARIPPAIVALSRDVLVLHFNRLPLLYGLFVRRLLADVPVDPAVVASRDPAFELHAQPGGWR